MLHSESQNEKQIPNIIIFQIVDGSDAAADDTTQDVANTEDVGEKVSEASTEDGPSEESEKDAAADE